MAQGVIAARLDGSFDLYDDLIRALAAADLRRDLGLPSNPIGAQLWCVVGGRETWARAIVSGTWGPFACSVVDPEDTFRTDVMAAALRVAADDVRTAIAAAPADAGRVDLQLGLLEHEAQHQGQLLRYLLGLDLTVPPSWREKFAL